MTADVHRPPPVSVSDEQIWPRVNVIHSGSDATTSPIEDDTFEPYYQQKSPLSSTKSSKSRLSWLPFRRRGSSTRKSTLPRSATSNNTMSPSNQSTPIDETQRISMESPRNIDTQHVVDIPSRDRAATTLMRSTSDGPQQARQHQPTHTHDHRPPQRNSINHQRSQTMMATPSRPIPSAMRQQPPRLQHERIVTFDANPLPAAYVVLAHDWDLVSSAITDEEELNVSRSRATTQVVVSTRLKTTTPLRRISMGKMSTQSSLPTVTSANSTTMSTTSSPVTSTTFSTHSKQTSMSISPRGRSQTTLSSSSPSTSEPTSPEESRNQPDSARSTSSTTSTSSASPRVKIAVAEITKRRKWYHRLFRTMPRNSKPAKLPTPATPVA